ncbi:hypothetical protein [Hymenobacter sp.]|uniref:hypothetical protein n=1 Tax=Hymenobacter sp. TaxID=1898978 RepID=UPI00286B90E4|nr:hypothetical protein [Hymenobacter sp.]
MKTYLLPLLAAFALTVGTAAAQTTTPTAPAATEGRGYGRAQGTPEEMATRQSQSQRLSKELGLSAEQTTKVQQILLARGQETQTMRRQPRDAANRSQLREQMQANRAKYDAQFKEVLTADQYTKFAAMQEDRLNKGRDLKEAKMKAKNGKVKIKKSDS